MFVNLDEDKRIYLTTEREEWANPGFIEFEFPEDFDFSQQYDYKIIDGELINDPLPDPEPEPTLTLEEVDAKATEAQTAATEAKTTADTANQTATTVQEQMDALTSAFGTMEVLTNGE